jgi:hypothetical protein
MGEKQMGFAKKTAQPGPKADLAVVEAIKRVAKKEIGCARAFALADELGVEPIVVGRAADEAKIRLVRCQLGIFGYKPQKKILEPASPPPPAIAKALAEIAGDGRISCKDLWALARKLGVIRMDVAASCEALNIRIKPCQLGAF